MKKRILGAVIAAVVMMLLFAACSDEPQLIAYETASKVSSVSATQFGSNYYVVVSWSAAKDGSGYRVFAQQSGTKSIIDCDYGQNISVYSPKIAGITGGPTVGNPSSYLDTQPNTDPDAWSKLIRVQYTVTSGNSSGGGTITSTINGDLPSGIWRFGVQTVSPYPNTTYSDIKWSEYVTVASGTLINNTW